MKTLESFSVLESFGLMSGGNGVFTEVSEIDMTDVVGGNCGAGAGSGGGGGWGFCICDGCWPGTGPFGG